MERDLVELAFGLFGLDTFRGIGLIQRTGVCLCSSMRQATVEREGEKRYGRRQSER